MTGPELHRGFLNLHAKLARSEVNGPGLRAVIWLQGCARRCPGCFNPDAQPIEPRILATPADLADWVRAIDGIEGITISGGEPMLQAPLLADFLRLVRQQTNLSVVVYTGYLLEELDDLPSARDVLKLTDVLIDGPYDATCPAHDGLRGSLNQRIHLLSARFGPEDFHAALRFEVVIQPDGTIIKTGVSVPPPPQKA